MTAGPARTAAARTPVEAELEQVWLELLGGDSVALDDDFFRSGGESILAARFVARASVRLGKELSLQAFVEEPTIRAFARTIETAGSPRASAREAAESIAGARRCSFAEERFWFIDDASGGSAVTNVSWALRLHGPLDSDALRAALAGVIARHESLRTHFSVEDGRPVQFVEPAAAPVLTTADVSAGVDPENAAASLIDEHAHVPFDLGSAPLLRAHLVRVGKDDHVLQFVAHHIVCDDWSKGVLHREIAALYAAAVASEPPDLPEPAIQYPDYSDWQRRRLDESHLDEELSHWRARLDGAPPALELPLDRPRPPVPTQNGARLRVTVPPEIADALRTLGREEGATFFMTMLAAFDVLLHRYTGEDDLVVGTAIDNRGQIELEDAIGLFTNVLALRTDLSGSPSFRELLHRVRATTVDAISHQELPFDRLAAAMPDRDPSRHPIFQVFYEFIVPAPVELPLPAVRVEPFDVRKRTTEFDLGLYLDEGRGGLDAVWEYSTDLFAPGTIDRLARHFVTALRGIVAEPDRPVAELPLLDAEERERVLVEWNSTAVDMPPARIEKLFEEQARRTPELPAVAAGDAVLSYAELNESANRVAHLLRSLGVDGGDAVGLCVDRSQDLVVALLGILKAGAAYVPLNSDHPPARIERQLDDAGVRVLLTQQAISPALPAFDGEVVCLDRDRQRVATQPGTDPDALGTAEDAVYILYTSGSTGVPKGVEVRHRNLVNYTHHMLRQFADGSSVEGWHFASVSAISTDLGNTTIFPSLVGGGCLHVVAAETSTDGQQFADYAATHAIDVLKITPSHLRTLLDASAGRSITPRRWLVLGGEMATWDLVDRVAGDAELRILNHYGPTEATVGCCTFEVDPRAVRPPSASVPIGRPISNVTAYVFDALGAPVPAGLPGELYVGGAGVAHGYVAQPEETAKRFVPDPFSEAPDARLYRTGDRVRLLDGGSLEFLGRADHQLKIRGFRVEPAEVEAALASQDGVGQAVVLPQGEGDDTQLAAFVVDDGGRVSPGALQSALAETLPAYMIPARVVAVDALPLTPNGKVDRRALLALATGDEEPTGEESEPRSEVEEQLVAIWAELLGRDRIGVNESFFEIGGHSLLAIRLVARLRSDFDVKLTLKSLIQEPTVRALAAKIAESNGVPPDEHQPPDEQLPPLVGANRTRPLRSSFAQEQFWLVDQLTPDSAAYNFSWPMRLRGALDVPALERAATEVVRRHEILRSRFAVDDGQPMQVVDAAPGAVLTVVDVSGARDPAAEAKRLVDEQTRAPFDLERGPLLRLQLLRLGAEDHLLQIVVHHIAFDGVSKVILYRDLGALYAAYAAAQAVSLPELSLQYGDYAEWQRDWLQGAWLERELAHWRQQLDGIPEALELPTDRPRPPVASLRGARRRTPVPARLRAKLEELARAESATFFMVMLAAFDVLLYRYSGQEDVVVGAPVDTRSRPELDDIVGPFLNTVVLRTDLSGAPTFRELLARVRELTLDAVSHQELPFERLVEALHPERDLSRHPIYQALLALNPPEISLELSGVDVEDVEPEWFAARVDLFLVLDDLPRGLEAVWEYSTDLFDAETIEAMDRHFLRLLEEIVADPGRSITELPLLADGEREWLLAWNETEAPIPSGRIEELIAAQAAATPERIAVEFEGATLTYRALDERANGLAHHLRALGVEPDEPVGISVARSADLVVGLLGILKAGGAYVPVDPAYPVERQRLMLEDARVRVVVTEEHLVAGLPVSKAAVVCLDRERDLRADAPSPTVDADGLAYVIYTSGSTGTPKGVEVPHRALANFLASMRERPGLSEDDVIVAVTTLSFDIAGLELYLPLVSGARLVIAPEATAADPRRLRALLDSSAATVMQATPTTWRMLVDAGWPGKPGLKALCGGEALPRALADELLDRDVELWNMYGPTETTIWSTVAHVETKGVPLTLGEPIANTTLFVLDERLQPVPFGVPGEVYIGGAGLARGYRGRPDLTAERFVADPFDGTAGSRLYRTGDLARRRRDGSVEFLGRLDQQVKVRGFRIELGEIETRLAQHPAVAAAVAAADGAQAGESRLIAYVVPEDGPVAAAELRRFLESSLPAYMIPSAYVTLDAIPLTPNGKVDRKALARPLGDERPDETYVAPATSTEREVARIWEELLELERVGIEDDFFEIGGHSLLAARLVGRLRKQYGIPLPLLALFEQPTVAGLAARIDAGPAQDSDRARLEPPPLIAASRTRQCSFAQERFWILDQITENSAAYNISWPLRLRGELDVDVLGRALTEIVRRHEALRARFRVEDGQPMQTVGSVGEVAIDVVEVRAEADRDERIRRLVAEQTQAPFDLEQGPLLRVQLLRLDDRDHVLQFVFHHTVFDGWSKQVLFRELETLYAAYVAGLASPLPELELQYGDYAEWQRSWVQGDLLEQELEYWKRQLQGIPAALELPADRPRPPMSSLRGAWHRTQLPASLVTRLRTLARREGATFFMTMLAALDVLLLRYTGQEDIVVGTPVDTRTDPALERLIGVFVNTVAVRTDLSGRPSFLEVLARVRHRTLDAIAHQQLPFERLVQELEAERDLSRHPIAQVLLAVNPPESQLALPGVEVEDIEVTKATARVDLALILQERGEGVDAIWEYSTELFEPETIERMTACFVRLLEGIVTNPDQAVGDISILGEGERRQLLVDWNDTAMDYPQTTFHELVESHVERAPDAVAVVFGDERLTYAELDARANQLAHRLRALGVETESLVGLCVDRSVELVVGLLGVLKAGAAYVPLDPNYPMDRLAFMLADSNVKVLLTQERLSGRLPSQASDVLCLDRDWPEIALESTTKPSVDVGPDNLAYVIYTSGSTGRPKGVLVEHRGLPSLVYSQRRALGLGPNSRVLQFSSLSFDALVLEVSWSLGAGGALHLASQDQLMPGPRLARLLRDEEITILLFPPSALAALPDESFPALETLTVGGEACTAELVDRWAPGRAFFNLYGPTEATICATYTQCREGGGKPSIGRPLGNTRTYVVDTDLNPVPVGVPGELCVGGVGVARGYLNRPELTRERFVRDPFSDHDGARLYRTGDLVRYRPDGTIDYLGRIDHQVKLRGYRIELGEIEAVLAEHPAVVDAVVVAIEGSSGPELAAYVVRATTDQTLETGALRTFSKAKLPDYMVPASFTFLEQLPTSPSGKVDRKALPAPDRHGTRVEYVAPATDAERIVTDTWAELLGLERVGTRDDFFELGGHSLLAARVVARLSEQLDVEVSIRAMFEHPVAAELAAYVEAAMYEPDRRTAGGGKQTIEPRSQKGPAPLSFSQHQLWFLDQWQPSAATYNVTVALRLRGQLDQRALQQALSAIVDRHEALRTVFVVDGDEAVQVVRDADAFELLAVDIGTAPDPERELRRTVNELVRRPFDLASDLMLRATLVRVATEEHVLVVQSHHIVFDGWSEEILFGELAELYDAKRAGRTPVLPEVSVSYTDFTVWQREQLSGETLAEQLAYWRQELAGAPTSVRLPTDRPRPDVQTFVGRNLYLSMPREIAEGVRALARSELATPFMVLLAGFAALLYRVGGQDDILFGTPVANRTRRELEHLIGFVSNTLVVRTRLGGNPTFRELVSRVRAAAVGAYAHQDMPFEKVVEAVGPRRDPGANPLFQVNFRAQASPTELRIPGLEVERLDLDSGFSRFDLALELHLREDEIGGYFKYNTDLFDEATIARLAADLEQLLRAAIARPDEKLLSFELGRGRDDVSDADAEDETGIRRFRDRSQARLGAGRPAGE